jgi:adenosylcobalamin-dependent ribonucleoside-triphosphate reductase
MTDEPNWGPSGQVVFERSYSRTKPDGSKESWFETTDRVIKGNLGLVYGTPDTWSDSVRLEYDMLKQMMDDFRIIPGGRHLWASGVQGRQFLFNCHVSHWNEKLTDHFDFTFMRLMEGGGVGTNYSTKYIDKYEAPKRELKVHIVCDPNHPDYQKMQDAGVLSTEFSHEWAGAFQVGDSREGWSEAMCDLIETYFLDDVKHYDRVYNVTGVREEGRPLVSFGGTASGPLPFAIMLHEISEVINKRVATGEKLNPIDMMEIDHSMACCVVSGGNRRSARMAMVAWDDPYVIEFINCKQNTGKHWTTNISVVIDDEFIELLNSMQGPYLVNDVDLRKATRAQEVYKAAVTGMLRDGEPGFWNHSLSQHGEVAEVVCTNPCGEITLQEWEACILGHVNMDAFAPSQPDQTFDIDGMILAHQLMTRFLIRASFGDKADVKQQDMVNQNRRIGVGHFGVQGFLNKLGIKFSKAPKGNFFPSLLADLYRTVRTEARDYAFELRIPEPVKVTTIAPTGSIAKLVGASEGIHPIYAKYFLRRIRFSTINQAAKIQEFVDQGYEVEDCLYSANTKVVTFPTKELLVEQVESLGFNPEEIVESADEISLEDMLAFQAMYQNHYADNAVSFTVNVPENKYGIDEAMQILVKYLPELKGTTIMVDGTRPQAPYSRVSKAEYLNLASPKTVQDSLDESCSTGACPIR